jgi:outer membrane autotransporter protein
VTGRPDPSQDANVSGLVNAQSQVARRFARAQISNYQRRMETLHVGPPNSDVPPAAPPRKVAERAGSAPDTVAGTAPYAPGFVRTRAEVAEFGSASESSTGIVPASFVTAMLSLAQSGTVSLANSTERGDATAGPFSGFSLWAGGNISFGTRGGSEIVAPSRFTTDGITVGGDWRVNRDLVLGMGVGYATDRTRFGDDGTKLKSDGTSVAVYGSFQPSRSTFVDALLGYGTLNFDSDRFVASLDQFAFANRDGHQIFGSVAAGFEYRNNWLLFSPYGRLDFTYDKFKQATENGAGLNALTYLDQSQHTFQGSLGMRAESQHETSYGLVRPRARIEYRHDFEGGGAAGIRYADQFAGLSYSVAPVGTKRNFLLLGAGSDFIFRGGLRLGVDYQWQSSGGADSGQAIRLLVSQELDGKGWPYVPWTYRPLTNAINVDGGFTYDDNVTRGRESDEILHDRIYSLNARTSRTFPVNDNTRAVVTGLLNGEAFHTYTGLAHVSGGCRGRCSTGVPRISTRSPTRHSHAGFWMATTRTFATAAVGASD